MHLTRRNVLVSLKDTDSQDFIDAVDDSVNAPSVAVVVDMQGLHAALGKGFGAFLAEGDLPDGVVKLGNRIGKVTNLIVGSSSEIQSDRRLWNRVEADLTIPSNGTPAEVSLTTKVMRLLCTGNCKIFLLVMGDSTYLDLAKEINRAGGVIALASPRNSRVMDIRSLSALTFSLEEVIQQEDPIDLGSYDFRQFIRLLDANERYLPFVGVQYFVERQMHRLGVSNSKTCQKIFHQAKEMGIVIVDTRANVDPKAKRVSTCTLNKEHSLVKEVLSLAADDKISVDPDDEE